MPGANISEFRAVLIEAIGGRRATVAGCLRFAVVGVDEESFLVELTRSATVLRDDDGAKADATIWMRKDDIPRLMAGWTLGDIRHAGRADIVDAFAALLEPAKSLLALRAGGNDAG